jgi:hypothetical protein
MTLSSRFSAAIYDPFFWLAERRGLAARRRRLLARASGRVLEIGAGTGLNAAHYPDGLDLVLTEPDEAMAARLRRRVASLGRPEGCNCNRPTLDTLAAGPLETGAVERARFPAMVPLLRALVTGTAVSS